MSTALPNDEQVKDYIDSVPGLRQEWGIPGAKRLGKLAFVIMCICLLAIVAGTIAYFMFADSSATSKGVSGLVIVLVLTYVACGIRIFQIKAERAELPAYRNALANALTGDPQVDAKRQDQVNADFKWDSLKYRTVIRMIGIAALVILTINSFQTGTIDYGRMLLFDGCIIAYLAGAFWNNFDFKADVVEVELEERCRATIKWQTEHPGEAQREEDSDVSPNSSDLPEENE